MSPLKFVTLGRFSCFRFGDFLEIRLYESKLYELKLYESKLYEPEYLIIKWLVKLSISNL